MLYNKFKTMFLVGEGDSVLSQVLNKSLAEQKQHEEANKTKEQGKKGANKKTEKEKDQTGKSQFYLNWLKEMAFAKIKSCKFYFYKLSNLIML